MKKTLKEVQGELASNLRSWQKIEDASVASTGAIIDATENPLIRQVMEIIQRDSEQHHRVQGWIAESLESGTVSLSPEELGKVWDKIEEHIRIEKKTAELAREALAAVESSKGMQVQAYLLEYLLEDEEKHNRLLERLESIKKGMYPYA
jgi:bacterioferritin (cytochrome b1)